jgi:uncharacterized protein
MSAMNALLLAAILCAPARAAEPAAKPRLAIVIDDFGLNYPKDQPEEDWLAIKWPITYAVMPVSPRTQKVAPLIKQAGQELIIHFPFDKYLSLQLPKDRVEPADLDKVKGLLEKAFKQIPDAKGLNNHQSYRGTMNRPMMQAFMPLIKPRVSYFLDSMVSTKSVAEAEARAAGIPAAGNNVFLDGPNEAKNRRKGGQALQDAIAKDKAFCQKYLRVAAALARRTGQAIAIGHHYYRGTYQCVVEEAPRLEKEGFELVYASALAR